MRILVLFDLPTGTKKERRAYTDFHKFLVKDGFSMEQFSVYSRVSLSRENTEVHIQRVKNNLPPAGSVTVMTMTEKQYEDRLVLLGEPNRTSNHSNDAGNQMTLLF